MSKFREINNHIEDIPMRFSDKFLSLQVNTFIAEDDDGENVNISNISEYKFVPELSAIEMFEQHQKKKLEQTLSNSVTNFSTVTNILNKTLTTTTTKDIQTMGPSELSIQSNAFTPVHKLYYSMVSGEILKPQTLNNCNNSISSSAPFPYSNCDNKQQPTLQRNVVNPKEFENDNSSPFDNVELQTIDDIKELNHVFQSISTTAEKCSSANLIKNNSHSNQNANNNVNNTTVQEMITKSTFYPVESTPINSNNNHQISDNLLTNPFYKPNISYSCLPSSSTHLQQMNHQNVMPSYQFSLPSNESPIVSNQTTGLNMVYSNSYTSNPSFEMKRSNSEKKDLSVSNFEDLTMNDFSTTLRPSKSVSDLTNIAKTQCINNSNNFAGSNCSLNSESRATCPVKGSHSKGDRAPPLPDPYDTLSDPEKQFVLNLCHMGFCQDRVSRAVKHIGINDDKKIFEYLLAFQQLEDKRYDCYEIEIALHMNNYNKDKAETFLQALKQICDFGFNKEDTIKALFKSNNDRDKAIDLLLNQSK